ncbi:MAG: phosphoenolpyruvate--protein phosphotransferase [Pyrinomonadaceae bacterium]
MVNQTQQKQIPQRGNQAEQTLRGRAVSRGAVVGKTICLHGKKRQFYRINLKDSQIQRELRRFRAAVRLAKRQLKKLGLQKTGAQTQILETHWLILDDNALSSKIETIIIGQKINAEWAVKLVAERYISIYKDIADDHLRERRIDLEDVTERLLNALGGTGKTPFSLEKDSIIVAREVNPSTLIELSRHHIKAIITENGGWTSHSFILARELNLPAVTGIKEILRKIQTGDEVVVDGYNGQVVLKPSTETLKEYEKSAAQFQKTQKVNSEIKRGALKTLDGRKIIVRVNLDISKDYESAKKFGAQGVGLFRSEFLFNRHRRFPSEAEQINAYRKIVESAGEDSVKIRTFDLNLEQIGDETEAREKNPALGLRAIRLSFAREKQFRAQLRALLQAARAGNLEILLPLISDVSEIRRAREILDEEKTRLKKKKIAFGNPKIGVMIEVPAAIMMIDEIAAEADFMNLGTNDLVQYLLAVDRDNEAVADWFRTMHPAVLRAVKKIIDAAENGGKPLIVCGEMAGSPVYVPILIGLGATQLSMNVNSISRVRRVIENIAFEEAAEIAKNLIFCKTADESEKSLRDNLISKWSHLYPAETFR